MMRTTILRLCGQDSGGPSEVVSQLRPRMRAPISPPLARKPGGSVVGIMAGGISGAVSLKRSSLGAAWRTARSDRPLPVVVSRRLLCQRIGGLPPDRMAGRRTPFCLQDECISLHGRAEMARKAAMDDPNEHSRRNIVLLSDGTGNSAGKLLKTNVWRLYQALDLSEGGTGTPQIACYNDGVGTSSFKPLALLGGAFGWGLKRNILHLYEFLCRNYRPGDRIYLFGFSRGAFTVRILAGLILTQGLVRCSEEQLPHYARQAYRAYRADRYKEIKLVGVMRGVRNAGVKAARWIGNLADRASGRRPDDSIRYEPINAIELIGVWDTVAAYGTPFRELTRGIDRWVWPLSMPDQTLLAGVKIARQA